MIPQDSIRTRPLQEDEEGIYWLVLSIPGDPSPEEALFIYHFDDGYIRYTDHKPSAILQGMWVEKTSKQSELDLVSDSADIIKLPDDIKFPIDKEAAKFTKGFNKLEENFQQSELVVLDKAFLDYLVSIQEKVRIRFQVPPAIEHKVRDILTQYGIDWPKNLRAVDSGSRGGVTKQYAVLGEVWFPHNPAIILPEGFNVTDGEARYSRRDLVVKLLQLGFKITDGPGLAEPK